MLERPEGSYTVFVPVNSVFRNLSRQLTSDTSETEDLTTKLHNFVLGHIVKGTLTSLPVGEIQTMCENVKIKVDRNLRNGKYLLNGNIYTKENYVAADNGVFYKIDGLLVKG